MAVKVYCDGCGCEIEHSRQRLSLPVHIVEPDKGGYVETKTWEAVSGRMIDFDLCPGCMNKAGTEAMNMIRMQQGVLVAYPPTILPVKGRYALVTMVDKEGEWKQVFDVTSAVEALLAEHKNLWLAEQEGGLK